jgi:hypothetical protein
MGLDIGFEDSPVDRASMTKGAARASHRRAAMKVWVFQYLSALYPCIPIDKSLSGRGNPRKTNSNFSVFSSGNG